MQPRKYQEDQIESGVSEVSTKRKIVIQLPTGGGKCLGWNTPVLMYDGSFKPVQEVVSGDQLMGIDSTPRNVTSTCSGHEDMYRIVPLKGEIFTCNKSHILSFKCCGDEGKKWIAGNTYNISVEKYLKLSDYIKHILKLYKSEQIEFKEQELSIPPYILGIWLGDGHSISAALTNMDKPVLDEWYNYADKNKYSIRIQENKGSPAKMHYMTSNYSRDGLTGKLRKLNLIENKHIPQEYLINSVENRLQLLAGLIDTDGYLHHNGYEIFCLSDTLANDIIYLVRSLGFYCKSVKKKGINGNRITFYGKGLEKIPLRISYKKCTERKQIKDALRTQFHIEYI